jgi:hypothetical protein
VAPSADSRFRRPCKCLDGLVHWVKDKIRRGIEIDPFEFDDHSLQEALQEDEGEDLADTMDAEAPEKFTPDRWIQWEIELTNYLFAKRGTCGVPLLYVIRPDLRPGEVIAADDITKQEIYAAPLEGATFRRDNNTVWNKTKQNS